MAKAGVNHVAIAERIIDFFQKNKGVGNTAAILDGARKTQANIVVVSEDEKGFKDVKARKQITFEEILIGELGGTLVMGFPLVVDNGALVEILNGLVGIIKAKPAKKKEKTPKQ